MDLVLEQERRPASTDADRPADSLGPARDDVFVREARAKKMMHVDLSAMPAFRVRVVGRIQDFASELAGFAARCEQRMPSAQECENVRTMARRLAELGHVYNFKGMSLTADALAQALLEPVNARRLANLALTVVRDCYSLESSSDILPALHSSF